jgi:glutamyl-tRNA reductase
MDSIIVSGTISPAAKLKQLNVRKMLKRFLKDLARPRFLARQVAHLDRKTGAKRQEGRA